VIASILNRQWRRTAKGHRLEGNRVAHLRTYWNIPCFVPKADAADGELMTIKCAAIALDVAPSTIHRLNNDGIIAGEQIKLGRDLAYPSNRRAEGTLERRSKSIGPEARFLDPYQRIRRLLIELSFFIKIPTLGDCDEECQDDFRDGGSR
jgi:hypothetical protein